MAVLGAAESERSVCTDILYCQVDWQFLTVTRCSQNLEKYLMEMQRFSKTIKHLDRPRRRDTQTHTHKLYTHTHKLTHISRQESMCMHAHAHSNTLTHRHLKANADTQTLVHCSLKLSLCVDFSGLLNLVWGQRRCPLDSFMQCSRFSGGRRDVSNSSHGHSTIR